MSHAAATGRWRRPTSWLAAAVGMLAAAALAAVVVVAAVHVDDRFGVDHASGARIALARYAAEGTLYPPLVDDGHFGGTRFMPLPIVLHAAAASLTGEYLMSGKLVTYAVMLGLLAASGAVLWRARCPAALGAGLLAAVLCTSTGLLAVTGLRGDSLPLLLQVLALLAVGRATRAGAVAAGLLAALAVAAKLHALWAPPAAVVWLWRRQPRLAAWFTVAFLAALAVLAVAANLASEGRMATDVLGLALAGVSGPSGVLSAPYRLLQLLVTRATAAWALFPAVVLAAAWWWRERRLSLWQLALAASLAVTLVVLTDLGTGLNQLIDPALLAVLVVGELAGRLHHEDDVAPGTAALGGLALSVAVAWVVVTGLVVTVAPALRDAIQTARDPSRYDPAPLAGVATADTRLLSEDPYVPVSLGQDPVVLDPFMYLRLAERHPAAARTLVERIRRQEFELVVLLEPLSQRDWWSRYHFGTDVADAIADAYRFRQRVQGYDVYEPVGAGP